MHDKDAQPQLRILYWFRSPPHVEIGRPALDPETVRSIEASNPDLRFDWDEILRAKPQPPAQDQAREARTERRSRGRRRAREVSESIPPPAPLSNSPEKGQAPEKDADRDGRRRTRRGGRGRRRGQAKDTKTPHISGADESGPNAPSATETVKSDDG